MHVVKVTEKQKAEAKRQMLNKRAAWLSTKSGLPVEATIIEGKAQFSFLHPEISGFNLISCFGYNKAKVAAKSLAIGKNLHLGREKLQKVVKNVNN